MPEPDEQPTTSVAPDDATPPTMRRSGARRSTLVVMVATLLTKVVGLVREVLIAALIGAGSTASAFTIAFQIPNVIRTFVADQALISSLVPVFTDLKERGEEDRAWRVASTVVSVLLLLLIPLTVASMFGAELFVDLAVHDHFEEFDLAVSLFRIMIPVVVLMSIGGVIIGILNAYGQFGPPAAAQLAFNAAAIVVLLAGVPFVDIEDRVTVYAWAVLVATVIQMLLPAPWLRGHGRRLGLGTAFRDPAVAAIVVAMLPVMLSLAMLNLNNIVNTYWSSRIPLDVIQSVAGPGTTSVAELTGAGPAVIDKAFRIFQLPQGIFSLAVATVFFPLFARHSARADDVRFRDAAAAGMRQIVVLLMPASVFMFVLAEPIVRLLYERAEFTGQQTLLVTVALQGFALGLIGNGGIQLLMRAFFSLKQPWTPAIVGFFVNFLGNVVLGGLLHREYGVYGITTSMAIANTASLAVMWLLLNRRLGGLPVRPVATALVVTAAASAISVGGAWWTWHELDAALGRGAAGQVVSVLAAVVVMYGTYGAIALKAGLVNVDGLRSALKRS